MNDLLTLARTIWGEARGETQAGRRAVAHVVLNRFRSGKWFAAETIAETCQKPWQFSCWNKDDPNRAKLLNANIGDPAFIECVYEAAGAMAGLTDDPTMSATHYHASNIHPPWADGKTSNCAIGRHIFYSDIA